MPWDPGVVHPKGSLKYSDTQEYEQFSMRENFSDGDKCLVGSVLVTTLLVITSPVEQPILQLRSPGEATVASNFNENFEVMVKDWLDGYGSMDSCLSFWSQGNMLAKGGSMGTTSDKCGLSLTKTSSTGYYWTWTTTPL